MRILHVINLHRNRGGADQVAEFSVDILRAQGHPAHLLTLDSRVLGRGLHGKTRAFVSGVYSSMGRRVMAAAIEEHRPEVVHIHDLYPFFSPWALLECRRAGVPVVMTCHDYRLTCPTAQHLHKGRICERCLNGKEYWCVLKNCRGSVPESFAYALRNAVARKWNLFENYVDLFISPCDFLRRRLVQTGIPESRMETIRYPIPRHELLRDASEGEYVAFCGRISQEKGVNLLLEAAERIGVPVRIAGDHSEAGELVDSAPPNAEFLGWLEREALDEFYRHARILAFPSIWYETFGLVMAEAMSFGLPVVASNLGPRDEIVDDGITGLLFENGNVADLAQKLHQLWDDPDLCTRLGAAGRDKMESEYSEQAYGQNLVCAYERAALIRKEALCK